MKSYYRISFMGPGYKDAGASKMFQASNDEEAFAIATRRTKPQTIIAWSLEKMTPSSRAKAGFVWKPVK